MTPTVLLRYGSEWRNVRSISTP